MPNVQFSIYKIDPNKIDLDKGTNNLESNNREASIIKILIGIIKESIKSRYKSGIYDINHDGFVGVLYRTVNSPDWNELIVDLSHKMDKPISFDVENVNVSYILFYSINECIYAMTAGFGNHLIKNYIEKNWGLYLMPKILGENEGVIRTVKENNIYGNELSVTKSNRNVTNLSFEKEIRSVFKELSIEINDEVAEILGISDSESNGKISVILKDSLNLRKSINLDKLKEVLFQVNKIEKKKDKYSMGYFGQINSIGFSKKELFNAVIDIILKNEYDGFSITGDDYLKYYIESKNYILINDEGNEVLKTNTPLTIKDIVDFCSSKKKLSKTYIEKVLKKWSIKTLDDSNNIVLYPKSVFESLDGIVEYNEKNIPCYLSQGQWYYFSNKYIKFLNLEFNNIINDSSKTIVEIKKKYKLSSTKKDENKYNDSFFDTSNVIVAHKSLNNYIEIADLIFWDNENVYLMCNKSKFGASGSRDLINQLWASANYLQTQLNSSDKDKFLNDFYESIKNRYISEGHIINIDKDKFKELFNHNIVYIAGYMFGYKPSSRSNYAKYLTVDCNKKISNMGYKFYSMNISD